jgi:flagellar motor protein MotB
MRGVARWLTCLWVFAQAGCAQNPLQMQSQLQTAQQQQLALQQRSEELQRRATTLDADNQELETLLAQTKQQSRLLEDQVAALQDQLRGTTDELARVRDSYQKTEQRAETLAASAKRRASASFSANSSLRDRLPAREIPGVTVRPDGDVVRLELPAGSLFENGSARLSAGASQLLEQVTAEIASEYPGHLIGVEGHTDSEPIRAAGWSNSHQLSVGRAMAVYDYLVSRTKLQPNQLFVVGHGANHPVVSNATAAGRERNNRVELVVYPETLGSR